MFNSKTSNRNWMSLGQMKDDNFIFVDLPNKKLPECYRCTWILKNIL